jgi:choline dehydrogenase-like flavoprotein
VTRLETEEVPMAPQGWDVVVVGAGSAGAAFAARSAARGKRVLLLEAGPDHRSADLPEVWRSPNPGRALLDPAAVEGLLWTGLDASRTDRQSAAPYWRGRGLGGSSSINGQIAIRPSVEDFEEWAEAGCAGWSPADVLPYFAQLEDDEDYGDTPHHGRHGPIPVHRTPRELWGVVDEALCRAAVAAGHPWAPDVNAPHATGVSPYPINSRAGRRVSVNDAYLEPARELESLTIRGGALVDRVLFAGRRAIGVSVIVNGARTAVYTDEIVLSAGAIHSPAILLRSGLGPARDLRSLGIEVRQDLPVGQGLQDHPLALVEIAVRPRPGETVDDRHTNVCVRYSSQTGQARNDMMLVSLNRNVLAMADAEAGSALGGLGVWVNRCHSRGVLRLASADPAVQPEVRERMLSDERDLARLCEGVRALSALACGPEIAEISVRHPAEQNAELFATLDDDARLGEHLLATVSDAQHVTSTCRMGGSEDPRTVVDPRCRVLGVEGLRVVDASIFPFVPNANTHLTAVMAGELAADRE